MRDLKALLDLLEQHGALSDLDRRAEVEAGAAEVQKKLITYFQRSWDIDPEDDAAVTRDGDEEAKLVLACPSCGPALKERWKDPARRALKERYGCTGLQSQAEGLFGRK